MNAAERQTIAAALDVALVDLINLGLLAKQAHWNVEGPMFRSLHLLLDELADLARDGGDEVAERAITLGHHPDGRAATVATSSLPDIPAAAIRDTDVVASFQLILDAVVERLHRAIDASSDDPVTQDLLTSIAAGIEKQAWMICAHT
ncbi:MAG: starvation/stationary phase protection protein [Acidimicrobiales bacterium]|nr:starvation/stationary phase protection protein [Acidimicrobiales bacterium]